ncbi:MAG: hypothetical protein JWR54_2936 [Mucilaginibacter sp.]|nr:hypothetical protein [Mucilaginibacter sp.]
MKTRFLFPYPLRLLGWILALPGFVLGYFTLYRDFKIPGFGISIWPRSPFFHGPVYEDLTKTLALMLVMAGLFLIAFSKEKKEDELTTKIRQNALYWAVLINYLIYLLWLLIIIPVELLQLDKDPLGSFADLLGMSTYNLFTPLLTFIARYYYLRYSKNGEYKVDKVSYLPEKPYKLIGQLISIPLLIIIILSFTGSWFFKGDTEVKEWMQVLLLFLPLTLLVWGYSRQHSEDEFISTLRLESMQLAVYVNYAILFIANLFLFFTDFLLIMVLNLGTIVLFFIIRFNFILWKHNKENGKGELSV